MEYENWLPDEDNFLKKKEIEIHDKFHNSLASKNITKENLFETETRKFRINALEKAINRSNAEIKGNILELGAGDGWCSAYLLLNYNFSRIFTMEINESAIKKLIPKVFDVCQVDHSKSTLVLGSFNNIKKDNFFDYVFVMGALHHSENLYLTFKNIYQCLKPGGWLIAQEPYMHNQTNNSFYFNRDEQEINFKEITKVQNNERTDVFYRECEYRVAGFHAGFDYQSSRILKPAEEKKVSFFNKTIPENIDKPNNLIIYAQKPKNNTNKRPITNWE